MSNVFHSSTLKATAVAGFLSIAVGAAAQTAPPVIYQGLPHTPIGNAILQLDAVRNALDVQTSDPNGNDGVAVNLGGTATSWSVQVATPPPADAGQSLAMTLHAVADGQQIASAYLRQVDADRLALSARFTGATTAASTYAVQVYDQGRLVGALGGLPPSTRIFIPIRIPCEFLEHGCGWVWRFHNDAQGACGYGFSGRQSGIIVLPNGAQLKGNEVRMIEEVKAAGQYPYLTFDGMTMQTNARVLTLLSESAR